MNNKTHFSKLLLLEKYYTNIISIHHYSFTSDINVIQTLTFDLFS